MPPTLPSPWQPMATAPTQPEVGQRGPVLLGVDASGAVHQTFYVSYHAKGSAWLLPTGNGLEQWQPVAWQYPINPAQLKGFVNLDALARAKAL